MIEILLRVWNRIIGYFDRLIIDPKIIGILTWLGVILALWGLLITARSRKKRKIEAERPLELRRKHVQKTDMEILVDKFDVCRIDTGQLLPCSYHRDRSDVRFLEQRGDKGEVNHSKSHIMLTPHPELLEFFRKMQSKTEVAGHWGLMKSHREWISSKLYEHCFNHFSTSKETVNILQCGIAGLFHYLGNLSIIIRQLDQIQKRLVFPPSVTLYTFDICYGSILPIKVYFDKLRQTKLNALEAGVTWDPVEEIPYIDVNNFRIEIDTSIRNLFEICNFFDERVIQYVEVKDLSKKNALLDQPEMYDIVMSHYLLNMWRSDNVDKLKRFCENLRNVCKSGANLFFALSMSRGFRKFWLKDYDKMFSRYGFSLKESRLTWDIYDLDFQTRDEFITGKNPMVIEKNSLLLHYEKV